MDCQEKHTKFQPDAAQWKCPKCSGNSKVFYINDGPFFGNGLSCNKLHEKDEIVCSACNEIWTGKTIAALLLKKQNLVKCSHCKGTGFVKKA